MATPARTVVLYLKKSGVLHIEKQNESVDFIDENVGVQSGRCWPRHDSQVTLPNINLATAAKRAFLGSFNSFPVQSGRCWPRHDSQVTVPNIIWL